jgi:hypothetical protein
MPHRRRDERESERIRTAAIAARSATGSAMHVALAQIGAAFDAAAAVNGFKLRVEHMLRLGPRHAAMRARFGARGALLCGRSLDAAIAVTERCWHDERKAFQIASSLGCGNRLSLEVLRELRLILRLVRFKKMQVEFGALVALLGGESTLLAAE